ncbi:MAG: O-methyltransferase [Clostridia bacterium]|nr:O-methyltransferase [Clostridia bacterium]
MKQDYLDSLIPDKSMFLNELRERSAREESYAPIVQRSTEQFIVTLMQMLKPHRVLEVGTAVGYSAILMADNLPEESRIITIERYKKHADIAIDNIFASGNEKRIKVIEGEASEVLHWLEGSFDFVFLDAAKGQYIEFLPDILRLLKKGGVLLSDNILYHGMVEDDEKIVRRKETIVKRLHMYLEKITDCAELTTSIIPIGDGVALSVRK